MNDLVFAPLKMNSTRVKPISSDLSLMASPHAKGYDSRPVPIALELDEKEVYPIGPAGCIWSNVDDLSKYLMMELRNGRDEDGHQLFAENQILARRNPGVKVDNDTTYGLGLFIEKDKGAAVIHHPGNMRGFTARMMFFPGNDIGMVILSNSPRRYHLSIS